MKRAGGTAVELGFGGDHGFHDTDLVGGRVGLVGLVIAGEREFLKSDDALKRRRLTAHDENIVGLNHHIACRFVAPLASPQNHDDFDLVLAKLLQRLNRHTVRRRVFGNGDLGCVVFEVEGRVHRGGTFSVAGQQAPTEDEKDEADDGDAHAHRREVKHAVGCAKKVFAQA